MASTTKGDGASSKSQQKPQRPHGQLKALHERAQSSYYSGRNYYFVEEFSTTSTRDELLQHSRYIRDYLAPMLEDTSATSNTPLSSRPQDDPASRAPTASSLPASELGLLRTVMNRLRAVPITLALLRHSRIEKALFTIVDCGFTSSSEDGDDATRRATNIVTGPYRAASTTTGTAGGGGGSDRRGFPRSIVDQARDILLQWEVGLGLNLRNLPSDLLGPGGRLEGMRPATLSNVDTAILGRDADHMWTVTRPNLSPRVFQPGHIGFAPGAWFINPPAAALAGIIAHPTYRNPSYITTCPITGHATALLLCREQETPLSYQGRKDGNLLEYHPQSSILAANILSLIKTTTSTTRPKVVRVLRSWTLHEPTNTSATGDSVAPEKGIRYDGLYRIMGFGVKLDTSKQTGKWTYTFTLARVGSGADFVRDDSQDLNQGKPVGTTQDPEIQEEAFSEDLEQLPLSSITADSGMSRDMIDDWNDYVRLVYRQFGIKDWGEDPKFYIKDIAAMTAAEGEKRVDSGEAAGRIDMQPDDVDEDKPRTESWDSGYHSYSQSYPSPKSPLLLPLSSSSLDRTGEVSQGRHSRNFETRSTGASSYHAMPNTDKKDNVSKAGVIETRDNHGSIEATHHSTMTPSTSMTGIKSRDSSVATALRRPLTPNSTSTISSGTNTLAALVNASATTAALLDEEAAAHRAETIAGSGSPDDSGTRTTRRSLMRFRPLYRDLDHYIDDVSSPPSSPQTAAVKTSGDLALNPSINIFPPPPPLRPLHHVRYSSHSSTVEDVAPNGKLFNVGSSSVNNMREVADGGSGGQGLPSAISSINIETSDSAAASERIEARVVEEKRSLRLARSNARVDDKAALQVDSQSILSSDHSISQRSSHRSWPKSRVFGHGSRSGSSGILNAATVDNADMPAAGTASTAKVNGKSQVALKTGMMSWASARSSSGGSPEKKVGEESGERNGGQGIGGGLSPRGKGVSSWKKRLGW